jgi:hypothetical protein
MAWGTVTGPTSKWIPSDSNIGIDLLVTEDSDYLLTEDGYYIGLEGTVSLGWGDVTGPTNTWNAIAGP